MANMDKEQEAAQLCSDYAIVWRLRVRESV